MLKRSLTLLSALSFTPLLMNQDRNADSKRHAICILYPNQSQVRGIISFSQDKFNAPTKIACSVKGFNPNSKYNINIHQYGDLTQSCATAGDQYNPHNKEQARPYSQQRPIGDLGHILSDPFGNAYMCFVQKNLSLYGQYSIVGRSVVLHTKEDDQNRGNNGQSSEGRSSNKQVACGIIGLSKQFKIVPPTTQ